MNNWETLGFIGKRKDPQAPDMAHASAMIMNILCLTEK